MWSVRDIKGYYTPRSVRRWNKVAGTVDYHGDAQLKLDAKYKPLIDEATHLKFNGATWDFDIQRDPGNAMGQERIILSLTRKE